MNPKVGYNFAPKSDDLSLIIPDPTKHSWKPVKINTLHNYIFAAGVHPAILTEY